MKHQINPTVKSLVPDTDNVKQKTSLFRVQGKICWALFHRFCSFVSRHLCPVNEVKLMPIKHHQILICNETFFLRSNTCICIFIVSFEMTCQKIGLRALSGFQTPRKRRMRLASGVVLLFVSRCLDPVMKHESIVLDILHEKV